MTDLTPSMKQDGADIARAGARQLEEHRAALMGHCYRMLGSAAEADDAVQETMVRAWRALGQFDGRSSLRTWLYRIATNVCLDALQDRQRAQRARPMDVISARALDDPMTEMPASHWVEPIPDDVAVPLDADPYEVMALRQSIRLAFVAALQHLPPKQRAVLLLMEVLDWTAADVAETLSTSVAAVNSALQRARATLAAKELGEAPPPLPDTLSSLLDRYVDAFERYDVDALTRLLCEDATLSMPPYCFWLRGSEAIGAWMLGRGCGCKGSKLLPTKSACGLPAFGQYRPKPEGGHKPWALIVLETRDDRISAWNAFLDTKVLFPRFGLPMELPAEPDGG